MKYRADVDGLRAVAVLAVVGFHAGLPWLTGGFVGVDVFFVISGFLIGGVVAERQARGDFSLSWFWERRIRRIFPALMVVLAAVSALAWWLLTPGDLLAYVRSMAAALVSLANIHFWRASDYFGAQDLTRPLLHTWSLGVEEQFYLVFPVFMLLAGRFFAGRARLVLAGLALASLALCIGVTGPHPESAFYLPVTRAWELLAGVLLAQWRPVLPTGALRHAAGLAGLALIVAACLLFSKDTDWPGWAAMVPTLGAVLVIAAEGGVVGRLLAMRPVVLIGLMSYSLYLWHWPLLTFQRLVLPGALWATLAVLLAVALSILSLRYIERPFRNGAFLSRRQVFLGGAAAILLLGAFCGAVVLARGFPQRFDQRSLDMAASRLERSRGSYRDGTCFISANYSVKDFDRALCATHDPSRPNWLLVGDSHAAHLWSGLAAVDPDINVMQATASGCTLNLTKDPVERDECARVGALIYEDLLVKTPPDGLLLAGRWRAKDLPRVAETLDWARARRLPVILIGPIPQYTDELPRLLILSWRFHNPDLPRQRMLAWPRDVDRDLRALAREKGVPYISLYDLLCDAHGCATLADPKTPLSWDYGHLTPEGSRFVAARLRARGLFPARGPAPAPGPGNR